LRKGEASFFLFPGERLEAGVQAVHVLGEEDGLLLRARETFDSHKPGDRWLVSPLAIGLSLLFFSSSFFWCKEKQFFGPISFRMILGPCEFVPPVEVEIIERRKAIPLDENEGIYVRDTRSGKVRSVSGQSYMLEPYEELWAKELPSSVEQLLAVDLDPLADRSSEFGIF
jgi:major vault protein